MNRRKKNKGFSMAEMLITVAILAVLAGLAFVGVASHLKNMQQLELDTIAKEIFVAAQNHLSLAESQGFPGVRSFGTADTQTNGVYYYICPAATPVANSLIEQMLPDGAVDVGSSNGSGTFIIRYQREPALVLDVFYASKNGRYKVNGNFTDADYYTLTYGSGSIQYRGASNKENRKSYGSSGAVVGWFGGEGADTIPAGAELKAPSIQVINSEKLKVVINDPNTVSGYKLQLIVKGETSGKTRTIDLAISTATQEYILDDICSSDKHFKQLFPEFYPGENITIQAKAFSTTTFANVVSSKSRTTNSLFDTGSTVTSGSVNAAISKIRHLENLSSTISGCGAGATPPVSVTSAVQTDNLEWSKFRDEVGTANVFPLLGSQTTNALLAINPANAISYDGGYHTISGGSDPSIVVEKDASSGHAGLFAALSNGSSVKNLDLIDFSITNTGAGNAGALVGVTNNSTITNVAVRGSGTTTSSSGDAGGLIGYMDGGTVTNALVTGTGTVTATAGDSGGLIGKLNGGNVNCCAASLLVVGGTSAGGLIGTNSGTLNVTGCYSGGHTSNGAYDTVNYNVTSTGGVAGGLIGDAGTATISDSYSTCSVKCTYGNGGFVGNISSGSISNCYCTGLVYPRYDGDGVLINDAFVSSAGKGVSYGSDSDKNYYYMIINEINKDNIMIYKEAGPGSVNNSASPLDYSSTTYDSFVDAQNMWTNADPYDPTLKNYYHDATNQNQAKYNLKSVVRLGATTIDGSAIPANYYVNTHYGDWPVPEIFIING